MKTSISLLGFLSLLISFSCKEIPSEGSEIEKRGIYLNQIGYYPSTKKAAIVIGASTDEFSVINHKNGETVLTAKLSEPRLASFSDYDARTADFSQLTEPGTYVLKVAGVPASHPFEVGVSVLSEVAKAAIKGFYYQRTHIDLPEQFAGKWARKAGHPDTAVYVHPSAATQERPEGTAISSPKGWYDAGDYNKYIVNSGITMGTMLSAYEDFPQYYNSLALNIPESNNAIPDLLDEVLWNLRWMLTMQDTDGGVYHKLTTAKFEGMVMPENATNKRWVVQKGTAATLDFAAVTAQASRVFRKFESQLPGLADSCLAASKKAWKWAQDNPGVLYQQDEMNSQFDPDIVTGAYGDRNVSDEFVWAASELYTTTGDESYYKAIDLFADEEFSLPSWSNVKLLGYYTLVRQAENMEGSAKEDILLLKNKLIAFGDSLIEGTDQRAWQTVMGASAKDYVWGSSSVAANQGIALLQVYRLTGDKKYLDYTLTNVDYLLGRNATGYSFVTGYGDKTPMNPHHRPSVADGIEEPVPGLLSGGPNPGQQDKCAGYPSTIPDESFTDNDCSYASNEIAINWNAPLVYLLGAVEAIDK